MMVGGPLQQRLDGHGFIRGLRHEGRIRAVLQQSPHQIGEQVAMAADRRVGAVRDVRAILAQLRIERLAHAVQALEFDSRHWSSASSSMVATVSALWVANCGKIRGRNASSFCAQAT